jgi:hypothetical protein
VFERVQRYFVVVAREEANVEERKVGDPYPCDVTRLGLDLGRNTTLTALSLQPNVLYKRVVITSESRAPPTFGTSKGVQLNHNMSRYIDIDVVD